MKCLTFAGMLTMCTLSYAQSQVPLVLDPPSCGKWVNQRLSAHRWWFVGFVSGLNTSLREKVKNDPLQNFDIDSAYLWIDNYCKANPLSDVVEGANQLYLELLKRKNPK